MKTRDKIFFWGLIIIAITLVSLCFYRAIPDKIEIKKFSVVDSLNAKIQIMALSINHNKKEREILIQQSSEYKDSILSERAKRVKAQQELRSLKRKTYSKKEIDSTLTRYPSYAQWKSLNAEGTSLDSLMNIPLTTGSAIVNDLVDYDYLKKSDTIMQRELILTGKRMDIQDSIINNLESTDSTRVLQVDEYDKAVKQLGDSVIYFKSKSESTSKKLKKVTKQRNASVIINIFQLLLSTLK